MSAFLRRARNLALGALIVACGAAPAANAQPSNDEGGGTRFVYEDANAGSVYLAGAFNQWNGTATPLTREGDTWSVTVDLGPGEHEYKFVVDGQWVTDPMNPVTVGDYGNSAISVGDDGLLGKMAATSNTPLNPKLLMTGRMIGTYRAEQNASRGDRYEIRRPTLDFDLDFRIRVNDDLRAHVLTNIHNEAENIPQWETRLNFDRGSLTLDNETLTGSLWDDEGLVRFDDPLTLLGNVGIYDHNFGYDTVGATARRTFEKFTVHGLFADDTRPGGESGPLLDDAAARAILADAVRDDGGALSFRRDALSYTAARASQSRDLLAARVTRPVGTWLGASWAAGVSARLDRSYNPGNLLLFERGTADTSGTAWLYPQTSEAWRALGGDLSVDAGPVNFHAEFLSGKTWVDASGGGSRVAVAVDPAAGGDGAPVLTLGEGVALEEGTDLDLGTSERIYVSVGVPRLTGALGVSGSVELHSRDFEAPATELGRDFGNDMVIASFRLDLSETTVPGTDYPFRAALGVEHTQFDYPADAPWESQFWFDRYNFWLEPGEHEVNVYRYALLGGDDATVWRPELQITLNEARRVTAAWEGTIAGAGFDKQPEFTENLFRVYGNLHPRWQVGVDGRFVRWDDPALELDGRWRSFFTELAFVPSSDIRISLSYGVDPWAIDGPVNEFAYIGRDLFLFANGATGTAAATNYRGLGPIIAGAEERLEDDKTVALEAVVRF